MIRGLNHITLAVADLERSLAFYRDLLGLRLRAAWPEGAYLEAAVPGGGGLWLCLSLDPTAAGAERRDYTHIAFDVTATDFPALAGRVAAAVPPWKDNRSEGASLYVRDPDGHRVELHVGSLDSRLADLRTRRPAGVTFHDDEGA